MLSGPGLRSSKRRTTRVGLRSHVVACAKEAQEMDLLRPEDALLNRSLEKMSISQESLGVSCIEFLEVTEGLLFCGSTFNLLNHADLLPNDRPFNEQPRIDWLRR
jgi:hypothetical protein